MSVVDRAGKRLKIPVWMLSPEAGSTAISERFIAAIALRTGNERNDPKTIVGSQHGSDSGQQPQ